MTGNLRVDTSGVGSAKLMADKTGNNSCGDELEDTECQGCDACEGRHCVVNFYGFVLLVVAAGVESR